MSGSILYVPAIVIVMRLVMHLACVAKLMC